MDAPRTVAALFVDGKVFNLGVDLARPESEATASVVHDPPTPTAQRVRQVTKSVMGGVEAPLTELVAEAGRWRAVFLTQALLEASAVGLDLFVTEEWNGPELTMTCTPVGPGGPLPAGRGTLYQSSKAPRR